ncbi:MAG TPA: rod shape-determining protein MreD [Burkholderiales bacterium]|nr:rod shape-determining protein MreD [Burkholderiales bacterium]
MQLSDSPAAQRILLPVRASTVLGSLAFALLVNFLPWKNVALAPDLVALVLVFWCVREPRLVGLGAGWLLGLLMDVGNGVLMGQHALAYSLLAFASITLSRRILWFPLWGQALHVAALLLFAQGVAALVRLAAGAEFPGWSIAVGPLVGAALWPVVSVVLLLPQRMPVDVDETRAI